MVPKVVLSQPRGGSPILAVRAVPLRSPVKILKAPELDSEIEAFKEINEVFFGAVAWILLHEIAHVRLGHEPDNGRSHKQEKEADEFAAKWVFKEVPTDREREFRIPVVGVALVWLLLFAPVGGDTKHPPAYARVMHVASY
jgi:Peptidase U49